MSTTTAPCNCGCSAPAKTVNERPRFYAGQLVTSDDLTLEQDYFRAKLRRHNRFMHGWGVVCGATVVPSNQNWKVIVKSGYVLGPYGDEIYIETDQCIDVRVPCTPPSTSSGGCEEAQPAPPTNATQYVVVQYVETQTRLVSVPQGGCGCNDNACQYTRYRDGYQICILDHCPNASDPQDINLGNGPAPDCPPCASEPWVALASFTVDANGVVTVQQCDCRRQALGFGSFWWACNTQTQTGVDSPNKPAPSPTPSPAPVPAPNPVPGKPASGKIG